MQHRTFTPNSARHTLKRIRPAAESMCRLARSMRKTAPGEVRCDEVVDPRYFRMLLRLQREMKFLREEGVRVEDPEEGLLDFPAEHDGRAVLLCWRVGEPTLCHWHGTGEDHEGRRPLEDAEGWD